MSETLTQGESDPDGGDGYVPGEWDEIRDAYLDGHLPATVYDKLRAAQNDERVVAMSERDAQIAKALLRRFTEGSGYWCFGDDFLTIDGRVTISADEAEALARIFGADGQGWWENTGGA